MDSQIEVTRQTQEEIERYERALCTLLSRPQPTHETRLLNEHKSAQIMDRISSRVAALNALYQDAEARETESNLLSADADQQNNLSEFYSRLVKLQEHHHKYPDTAPGGFDAELAMLLEEGNQDGVDEDIEEEDRTPLQLVAATCVLTRSCYSGVFAVLRRRSLREILGLI